MTAKRESRANATRQTVTKEQSKGATKVRRGKMGGHEPVIISVDIEN